jgi:hypothetical protein
MLSNGTFIYHSVACWFGDEYAAWIEMTCTVFVDFIPSIRTYKLYGHDLKSITALPLVLEARV